MSVVQMVHGKVCVLGRCRCVGCICSSKTYQQDGTMTVQEERRKDDGREVRAMVAVVNHFGEN